MGAAAGSADRVNLVDARDIVERHTHGLGIDALLFAAAQHSTGHGTTLSSGHPGPEGDEEQEWRERHQQVRVAHATVAIKMRERLNRVKARAGRP